MIPESIVQAPVYLTQLDGEGKVVWFSRLAHGFEAVAVRGQPSGTWIDPRDLRAWDFAFARVVNLGEVAEGIARVLTPGVGRPLRQHYRIGPLRERGRITGAWVVSWDVAGNRRFNPLARFLLSPRERRVVAFLLANEAPQIGFSIGRAVGEVVGRRASHKLRALLAGLAERGILTHRSEGYTLTDEFRPHARRLLST